VHLDIQSTDSKMSSSPLTFPYFCRGGPQRQRALINRTTHLEDPSFHSACPFRLHWAENVQSEAEPQSIINLKLDSQLAKILPAFDETRKFIVFKKPGFKSYSGPLESSMHPQNGFISLISILMLYL